MKIIVISDTHTDSIDKLPRKLVDELGMADLIIHSGDFTDKQLVDDLRKLNKLRGVYGNIDGPDVRRELPEIDTVETEGFKIGLNHPAEGGSPMTIEQRIRKKFEGVDVIIHGHSHRTKNEVKDGVLWFNPGSATGKFPALRKTYGILTLDKEIHGEIIEL
jgi:uncharacterized protein